MAAGPRHAAAVTALAACNDSADCLVAVFSVISKSCNFVTLGQITEYNDRPRMKTILQAVSKFEFDRICFQKGEASANFGRKVE